MTEITEKPSPPRTNSVLSVSRMLDETWFSIGKPKNGSHFLNVVSEGYRDSPKTARRNAIETYLRHGKDQSLASPVTTTGRKAGKPIDTVSNIRLMPDMFATPGSLANPTHKHEALVLRRERFTATDKRADYRSAPGHLAFTRHALERIHLRNGSATSEDLGTLLRTRVAEADRLLAYAWASGTHLGPAPQSRTAATAIPFLDGLLLVQNRLVAVRYPEKIGLWLEARARHVRQHPTSPNPLLLAPCPDFRGHSMTGMILSFATTYVSKKMMRPEQVAYADRFLDRATILPDDGWLDACFEVHSNVDASRAKAAPDHLARHLLDRVMSVRKLDMPLLPLGFRQQNHPNEWSD